MQTTLICYADEQMTISQQLCVKSAVEVGKIDHVHSFGPRSIDKFFYERNRDILEAPQRGGGRGFWLWKPYIVEQAIRYMKEGDILIYCDSGVEWIADVKHLINRMWTETYESENDIFLFSNGHRHIDWCKSEVLCKMFGLHNPYLNVFETFSKYKQVQASVMLFRVNTYTRDFCSRWLNWCCIPGFIDDSFNPTLQQPEFREHRNDQSVLTNLAIEDDISLHWWPAQYWQGKRADFPRDSYPQMFYHHRYRNPEWEKYRINNGLDQVKMLNHFMSRPKNQ